MHTSLHMTWHDSTASLHPACGAACGQTQSFRARSCQLEGSIGGVSSVSISIRKAALAASASAASASGWKQRQEDGSMVSVVSRMAASTAFVSSAASSQGCSVGFFGSIVSRVTASTASSAGWHHQLSSASSQHRQRLQHRQRPHDLPCTLRSPTLGWSLIAVGRCSIIDCFRGLRTSCMAGHHDSCFYDIIALSQVLMSLLPPSLLLWPSAHDQCRHRFFTVHVVVCVNVAFQSQTATATPSIFAIATIISTPVFSFFIFKLRGLGQHRQHSLQATMSAQRARSRSVQLWNWIKDRAQAS